MGDRANDNLPLICGECGGGPVRAVRAIDRVLIRCSACKKRLFAYYLDPARAGDIPPEREDEFLARLDERERIKKLSANAQARYEGRCHNDPIERAERMQHAGPGLDRPPGTDHVIDNHASAAAHVTDQLLGPNARPADT